MKYQQGSAVCIVLGEAVTPSQGYKFHLYDTALVPEANSLALSSLLASTIISIIDSGKGSIPDRS